ncbi:hypothetical protein [Pseudofrankia sp. DC12]|uniref:hypothetical protein n=1 Tax=Pseudofrankia sp. DC12 TaxID=683315 RepID=UPI0005F7EFCE|nr:hypothetical protein [Pseudofrankia sp. DC12]
MIAMTVGGTPGDTPAGPGDPPPTTSRLWADAARFPVCVQVRAGWWRLRSENRPGHIRPWLVAELVSGEPGPALPPILTAEASSVWQLEERLGWALPPAGHDALLTGATRPVTPGEPAPAPPPDAIDQAQYRPWRGSLVLLAGRTPATYGRLIHDSPPARRWSHADLHVDVVDLAWSPVPTGGRPRLAYRLTQQGKVLFAGDDAPWAHGQRPDSTEAVRAVLATILARPTAADDRLTDRQRHLFAAHGTTLATAARPAHHPYLRGTRVTVAEPGVARPVTGTVVTIAAAPAGALLYRWRPDVADLPGHPWRDHPGWTLETPRDQVTATLDTPDLRTTNPDGQPAFLATGAQVTAIDDPRFSVATVLRAYAGDGPTPRYEIQPHDSGGGPIDIAAHEVAGQAGTAWASLDDLLLARAAGDLPIRPFEVLTALRDCGIVTDSPHGPRLHTRYPLADAGTALDPDGRATPVELPVPAADTRPLATLSAAGGLFRLNDPTHGPITVPQTRLIAALHADPDQVAALLARRPWLPAGPHPRIVAAALAALHAPDGLQTLTASAPPAGADGPAARDGPPPGPDPTDWGLP